MSDHPSLTKHVPLVNYLGTQAVSSDESENDARRTHNYPRVYPRWRSEQLAALMWLADAVATENDAIPLGTRKKSGALFRFRPHTGKYNDQATAPVGLPRNCYDSKWLASLPPRIVQRMKIQEKDYDFGTTDATGSPSAS